MPMIWKVWHFFHHTRPLSFIHPSGPEGKESSRREGESSENIRNPGKSTASCSCPFPGETNFLTTCWHLCGCWDIHQPSALAEMSVEMVKSSTGMHKALHVSSHKLLPDEWEAGADCSLLGLRSLRKSMKDMGDKARMEGFAI